MDKSVIKLGILLGLVATIGILAAYWIFHIQGTTICVKGDYCRWGWMILSVTLVLIAIVCLFGVLALPGGRNAEGGFTEERIRLSVAATLMVAYFVLFSTAVFFGSDDKSVNEEMMNTLTQLMTIVLPFYFGTSGLVEWAKRRERTAA